MYNVNKIESCVLAQTFYRQNRNNEISIFDAFTESDINISDDAKIVYNEDCNTDLIHLLEIDDEYFVIYLSDHVTDELVAFGNDKVEALEYCAEFIVEQYERVKDMREVEVDES